MNKLSILSILMCVLVSCGSASCGAGLSSSNTSATSSNEDDVNYFDYYPLDDGTLGIKQGKTLFLSKIVIPSSYQGRTVTRILTDGFHLVDRGELYIPATIRFVESKGISGRNITLIYDGPSQQFSSLYRESDSSAFSSVTGNVVCTDGSLFLDPIDGLIGEAGGDDTDGNDLSHGASITYWCPETDAGFFAEKAKSFKAAHPEFKGDITNLAAIDEDYVKYELTQDAETAADVFEIADDNIPDCVSGGAMTAFEKEDVDLIRQRCGSDAVHAVTYTGKTYGVPYRNDNGYVLSYDTSIVSAEQAKTVEGIIAACKAAGATFNFDLTYSWYTFAPIWAAGGKTYTDENGVFHSEIATDAIAEVAAGFAKIVADAGTTWNHSDDDANFGASTGRVGAVVKWNNEDAEKELLGDKLAITTLPSFTVGGKSYALKSFQGFKALGMRRAAAFTDAKKITARAFCLFMGSDEVAEERLTALKQGVPNESVIAKTNLWDSEWIKALATQQAAGNTVSQANGSSDNFWSPADALGAAIKGGTVTTKEAMLRALTACQVAQNA